MGKGPLVDGREVVELGNYFKCSFVEGEFTFTSVEQYFQFHKSEMISYRVCILACTTPLGCWRLGRSVVLRDDWESLKVGVMERANRLKFTQNKNLCDILRMTSPHPLVFCEHTPRDFWDMENQRILEELRFKM
jgi:ribA/ribD-fused uncharacterized protein